MTYWQRLCIEYPDMEKYGMKHKKVKCPCSWGYEKNEKGACQARKSCEECWMREVKSA